MASPERAAETWKKEKATLIAESLSNTDGYTFLCYRNWQSRPDAQADFAAAEGHCWPGSQEETFSIN